MAPRMGKIARMDWESRLRELYPAPNIDGIKSWYFALDGGGRDLIVDVIQAQRPEIMLEIGCYLCGSTRQWLDADPDLKVIGVDPWDGPFAPKGRQCVLRAAWLYRQVERGHVADCKIRKIYAVGMSAVICQ